MIQFLIFVAIGYALTRMYSNGFFDRFLEGFNAQEETPQPTTTKFFPCVITGTFTMPSHEARIAARNTSLTNKGVPITGNDDIDNAVLGGGSPDGGIWLSGSYRFEIDARGQQVGDSWISIFSDERHPVTGGVTETGEIRMASPAGVTITGAVKNGIVTGKVSETGTICAMNSMPNIDGNIVYRDSTQYIEYVHGVMSGSHVLR